VKIDRRTVCRVLGALPFFGWLDPLRSIIRSEAAVHYRAKHDGRSIHRLLRDDIRNGIYYGDLKRILGPFKIFGPVDHDYTVSEAPGWSDFRGNRLSHGHYLIQYPMSYMSLLLEIKDGYLVNHDPMDYNDYPDRFVYENGQLNAVTRPLNDGPLKHPPPTHNLEFDS
jgi:hypothetical protein